MESSTKLVSEPIAWVQCDDKKCLKWRKVPKRILSTIENAPWFCHMNPDKEHASCCAKQEEMKVPKGETVVFSLLEEGSLVWAKVCGYPRWPSIICSDIVEDNFASFDDWGDVTYYHVEYFGDPRTHSWILAKDVEIYGSGNAPAPFLLASHKGMKAIQSRKSFQRAIKQADKLTLLQPKERLKHCFFQPNKTSDVLDKEGGFVPGNSQEFIATQKKIAQKDEKMHKLEPLSALESQYTNESTKKRRRRKRWELDPINLASKIGTHEDGEVNRRRKVVKNDCLQCCSAPDSASVNTKQSMAKNSTSAPSGLASSLRSKWQQSASKEIKQKGVCLLNINGVVVPAMLQTSNSNSNVSSQEKICHNNGCDKNESVCNFSATSSYQNKDKLDNKEVRILDAGEQSSTMQHTGKEKSFATKQVAQQVGCSSKQKNEPSSMENMKQISSVKLPKMALYKINLNKPSEGKKSRADLELVGPFKLTESAKPPADMGNNSQKIAKIDKDIPSGSIRLNSVTQEIEDVSNQSSSESSSSGHTERTLKQESIASPATRSGKQETLSNGGQPTEKSPRTLDSFPGESFPVNVIGPEEEKALNQVQMSSSSTSLQTSSHPSKLLEGTKPAASFKALFTQYASIKKLEESERCIKYNGKTLDLCCLYFSVQNSGGFDKANRDECWKLICKKTTGEERPSTIHWLKEMYQRTLLPFDEYLQSLNIIHPEKRPQEYDKVNTYCIEGDQPEKSLTRKDELQKNPQEYGIQQGNGSRDESNQKDGSLAKGESIVKGDEEEDVLYTLMDSKANSPKQEREDFVYNGAQSEGIDFDMYSGVNDDLLEISATNDNRSTEDEGTLDVMEVLEILQTAITDAELSLYDEDGLSSVESKTGRVSSEQKLQSNNTTDESGTLFEELDALEESIADYSSILEMS